MPWFLVGDSYPIHPGVLATSLAARGLWVTAGAWSSANLTDVVPDHVVASLGGTPELTKELAAARVWKRVRGGYRFQQEGLCKIPSTETVDNARKSKAERQRRWRESQRRQSVDASTRASPGSSPDPHPVVDVVNLGNGSSTRASPDVIDAITQTILEVTGRHITPEWADRIANEVIGRRVTSSPAAYVAKAIRNDPDPKRRFLPLY